jgi:hypothetical protein
LVLLAGCGSDDDHVLPVVADPIPAPPVVASVFLTVNPAPVKVVTENPVRIEIETKPAKVVTGVEIDLNNYGYKYRYEDEKEDKEDDDTKKNLNKKD